VNEEITALPEEVNGSDAVSPDNGLKPTEAAEISLNVPEQGGASETVVPLNPSEPPIRRTSGPRSELGKQRASRNATKHGIFSRITVLQGESRARVRVIG